MKKIKNMDVEWGYTGDRGPEHWHELCDWYREGATYPYQSPIALHHQSNENQSTLKNQDSTTNELSFYYVQEHFTEKEFKNTLHFVPYDTQSYVLFRSDKYVLTDIHVHMPSEHQINGQQEGLEFHLVHMNEQGDNLVLGVLFNLSETGGLDIEKETDVIWDLANHSEWFNPIVFLPQEKSHFYYVGSLTTPPTVGPINWFVFDTVQPMSRQFIAQFKNEITENNNRPLQPIKDRKISYFTGVRKE
ncbi:carbonic anhydrase [Enterococcus sp. JM4C]|uniref:carbonic anhydrase family protein n=1 Tax=Candidatus Enterococcus huntleyi TaxID=1857217 RepID=UPI00137B5DDC|nr:carbonic anhydrase family protein [Enterococcus sp. JM4C]KAF1296068.1 carbonic anhydrase [Enterococcus sp. JM4C]